MLRRDVCFAHFPGWTVARGKKLIKYFSSWEEAWLAKAEQLIEAGWKKETASKFCIWRKEFNEEEAEKKLYKYGINCLSLDDAEYPHLLKRVYDPPFVLFVRGTLDNTKHPLAVVGTRSSTAYGKQVTEDIISRLSQADITIVSGLALGIDAIAHKAALDNQGHTVAVLGSGCNDQSIQPAGHRHIAKKIIKTDGAVISEYPPGTMANKFTFPRRNRIIAGISLGTLVIEAPLKSGALITAQYALDSGREIMAVPQNINNKTSKGVNKIIAEGAHLVTSAKDILKILGLQEAREYGKKRSEITPSNPTEAAIINLLSRQPVHVDDLIKKSELTGQTITSTLTLMEVEGKIKNLGGMNYILN